MRKNTKIREWNHMPKGDRSYLLTAYKRYSDMRIIPGELLNKTDNFHQWLFKRGIHKKFCP